MDEKNLIVKVINNILRIIEKNKSRIKIERFDISGVKIKNMDVNKLDYKETKDKIVLSFGNKTIINFKYLIDK